MTAVELFAWIITLVCAMTALLFVGIALMIAWSLFEWATEKMNEWTDRQGY